jgi:hypothetical protein
VVAKDEDGDEVKPKGCSLEQGRRHDDSGERQRCELDVGAKEGKRARKRGDEVCFAPGCALTFIGAEEAVAGL